MSKQQMPNNSNLMKTIKTAEMEAFTCQLVYFTMKILVIVVLYKYNNVLKSNTLNIVIFTIILLINTYLMRTTGNNPGYSNSTNQQQTQHINITNKNICSICQTLIRNRMKHCYKCGRCVMKYDHHCSWIGSCVGQLNQCKFWTLLLTHTIQSSFTLSIFYSSLGLYHYSQADGTYSQQYGTFCIFAIIMLIYLLGCATLLCFHSYLIVMNITSRQILKRHRVMYLNGLKYNPFNQGIVNNIKQTIFPRQSNWQVTTTEKERSCLDKIWSNDYYQCCSC